MYCPILYVIYNDIPSKYSTVLYSTIKLFPYVEIYNILPIYMVRFNQEIYMSTLYSILTMLVMQMFS